jgi:hypothetical protein
MTSNSAPRKARITTSFEARSVETGEVRWLSEGTLLWHVEVADEVARFMEIGERGSYEFPADEFRERVKVLSR